MPLISDDDVLRQPPREEREDIIGDIEEPETNVSWENFAAGWKSYNTVASAFNFGLGGPQGLQVATNAEYDPFQKAKDMGRLDLLNIKETAFVDNDNELDRLMSRVDEENRLKEMNAQMGSLGIVNSFIAGGVDPFILVPGTAAVKAGSTLFRTAKGAASGAALGAAAGAGQETALTMSQLSVDRGDIVEGAIGGAIFGGALGGVAVGFGARGAGASITEHAIQNQKIIMKARRNKSTGAAEVSIENQADVSKLRHQEEGLAQMNSSVAKAIAGGFRGIRSPIINGLTAPFATINKFTNNMFEHNLTIGKNLGGVATDESVESLLKQDFAKLVGINRSTVDAFNAVKKQGLVRNFQEFDEALDTALRSGDVSTIPEVENIAKQMRPILDNQLSRMQELGIMSEAIDVNTAASWFRRTWDQEAVALNRDRLFDKLTRHFRTKDELKVAREQAVLKMTPEQRLAQTESLKKELNDLQKANTEMKEELAFARQSRSADLPQVIKRKGNLMRDMERIQDRIDLLDRSGKKGFGSPKSDGELSIDADETIANIQGLGDNSPAMQLAMQDVANPSKGKFTKERVLDIPDLEIHEFLKKNGTDSFNLYMNQSNALIRAHERLQAQGFDSIVEARRALRDEADVLIRETEQELADLKFQGTDAKKIAKKERELLNLNKERDLSLEDMNNQWSMMLGQFGDHSNTTLNRSLGLLRKYQMLRLLGNVTISSLGDMAMPIFKHGLGRTLSEGYLPLIKNLKAAKLSRQELADIGVATDLEINNILTALTDPDFSYARVRSPFERKVDKATELFGRATFLTQFTGIGKRMAGRISVGRTMRVLQEWDKTGRIPQKEKVRLAKMGIGEDDYADIMSSFKQHGAETDGSFILGLDRWKPELRERVANAIITDVDSTILTPGRGDVPFIAQRSEVGKTITQFKSFLFAATNKIAISGLQRRDSEALQGIVAMVIAGGFVSELKRLMGGREREDVGFKGTTVDDFLLNGIQHSGVGGIMAEAGFALNPWTENTRYVGTNAQSFLGGPSVSLSKDVFDNIARVVDGDFTKKDEDAVLRMLPFQNLYYLRKPLDIVREAE